ncbi:MAG: ferredoxin [Aquificota bacterium]|uniref:Ferredoxin n=1 Tax=Hydrogenobacter sp. TaxID=2152829 RepID=A0A7C2VFH6_9AQUI|nr:ferredoxin [Aquificaceae bacterium]HAV40177.1 ferredoxin [Aquificaceae bacterium]HCO38918.1 ferredoxin [Aquificaceae bacterium]
MSQWVHHNGRGLKIEVDIDTCTACQLCYERLPEVFVDRGDGLPLVFIKVSISSVLDELLQVAEDCPSNSILVRWIE